MDNINGIPANRIQTQLYKLTDNFLAQDWVSEHRRWSCYMYYGVQCSVPTCTRTGTHVIHWYDAATWKKHGDAKLGEHIDLIGYDPDGSAFLMTVDHIIPKVLGGPKIWWNLQPMCSHHNFRQQDKMKHKPKRSILETLAQKSGSILQWDSVAAATDAELHDIIVNHYRNQLTNC